MLRAKEAFAADLTTPLHRPRWLSFLGSPAAGKTMLAREIHREALAFERQHPMLEDGCHIRRVCWRTWPALIAKLRDGEFRMFNDLLGVWFLVIDDIGAEHQARDSGFALSKLYELLNARLGKWTVLTSNLDVAALAQLDARIASRLIRDGNQVVAVDVPDFNQR